MGGEGGPEEAAVGGEVREHPAGEGQTDGQGVGGRGVEFTDEEVGDTPEGGGAGDSRARPVVPATGARVAISVVVQLAGAVAVCKKQEAARGQMRSRERGERGGGGERERGGEGEGEKGERKTRRRGRPGE